MPGARYDQGYNPPPEVPRQAPPTASPRNAATLLRATTLVRIHPQHYEIRTGADSSLAQVYPCFCYAAENGHLNIVQFLVDKGADVNRQERTPWTIFGIPVSGESPLFHAGENGHLGILQFLIDKGANLNSSGCYAAENRYSDYFDYFGYLGHFQPKDCPTFAAMRAQERGSTVRRLLTKISKQRLKLQDAVYGQSASKGLAIFAKQLGTSSTIWKTGTRAIRDIVDGYLPGDLSDIISALQVAYAMRAVVPPSELVCSKQEFVNDLHRWASLIMPSDKNVFVETASCLWGNRPWDAMWAEADNLPDSKKLFYLQELVDNLVSSSGLFDKHYQTSSSFRLRSMRHRRSPMAPFAHGPDERIPLTEWRPLDQHHVQDKLHTDDLRPPDPVDSTSMLARITVIMAGAIFGAILLYLCQVQRGFTIPSVKIPKSLVGQGWISNQILVRNCFILTMYLGLLPSFLGSGITKDVSTPLADITRATLDVQGDQWMGGIQEHMPASNMWPLREGVHNVTANSSLDTENTRMYDALTGDSSDPSSNLGTSSPSTLVSTPSIPPNTPGPSATPPQEDGTVQCHRCSKPFRLGENGRRGRNSNLRKHVKRYHPEDVPNYHRVMHQCKYGCGRADPDKSNIRAHEDNHCSKTKGKQPRRNWKWRGGTAI